MYQVITPVFNQKDDTLRLFSRKNFFSCAYKLDGKSKKVSDMKPYRFPKNYAPT